ncbi:MAG TPA: DJ-1/PfpI family protein [Acidimicrobiales bacterium]|jgi:transcriptional regulator GlxA family with amidase domain
MLVAILLFHRVTALDAVGPYEVLQRLPGAEVVFTAARPGPQATDGTLSLVAATPLADVPAADVLVVPGGFGTRPLVRDEPLLAWIRQVHATTTWTASVCTGSLLLAAAGLLDGCEAATHWRAVGELEALGARPVGRRVVDSADRIVTAAGVSSGIDMALVLAARLAGDDVARSIQLAIEYDPEPPFDAGSPDKAGPAIVELAGGRPR